MIAGVVEVGHRVEMLVLDQWLIYTIIWMQSEINMNGNTKQHFSYVILLNYQ